MSVQLSRTLSDKATRVEDSNVVEMLNREIVPYLRELGRAVQALTMGVAGGGSSTDNAIARWNGTAGATLQNSLVTISDTGSISLPASETVDGVDVSAHQARHAPGGADDLFSGALTGETLFRFGGSVAGFDNRAAVKTSAQSEAASVLTDVSELVFTNLKAGARYLYRFVLSYTSGAAGTGMQIAVNYSGTLSSTMYSVVGATSATALVCNNTTTNNALIGATGAGPNGTNRMFLVEGFINVTTAGDLQLRFQRGAAASSVTIQLDSYGILGQV